MSSTTRGSEHFGLPPRQAGAIHCLPDECLVLGLEGEADIALRAAGFVQADHGDPLVDLSACRRLSLE